MGKSLKDLLMRFVSVVDKGDNPEADIVLLKGKDIKEKGGESMKLEDILKELGDEKAKVITDTIAEKDAKIGELEKKEPEVTPEPEPEVKIIEKADPEIKALVEKMQTEKDAMVKELSEIKGSLSKAKIEKDVEAFEKISAKEELIDIFTEIDDKPETVEKLKGVLKAVNEALTQETIMKTVGVDGDPNEPKAMEKLEKRAKEIAEADKVTKEEGMVRAMKEDPKLYQQYLEEQ